MTNEKCPTIRIIDNNVTILEILQDVCSSTWKNANIKTYLGNNNLKLLELCNSSLLILDQILDNTTGIEIIKEMANSYKDKELPAVILMTGIPKNEILSIIKESNIMDRVKNLIILFKPFHIVTLHEVACNMCIELCNEKLFSVDCDCHNNNFQEKSKSIVQKLFNVIKNKQRKPTHKQIINEN